MTSANYTKSAQKRFRQFVAECGTTYIASEKLGIPSFFVEQMIRNEPVPEHILEKVESTLRRMRPGQAFTPLNTANDSHTGALAITSLERALRGYIKQSGGVQFAALKLVLRPSTIQRVLSGLPVSFSSVYKLSQALKRQGLLAANYSLSSRQSRQQIDLPLAPTQHESDIANILRGYIARCGGVLYASERLGVRPSTIEKLIYGKALSKATLAILTDKLSSLGLLSKPREGVPQRDIPRTPSEALPNLATRLKQLIKSDADILNLSSQCGMTMTSLKKIYNDVPVSRPLAAKLETFLNRPDLQTILLKKSPLAEKLEAINHLYLTLGTLESVGERLNITRERVRQLLVKGAEYGLFKYTPRNYPFVPKEKLIEDYKETLSLNRVATRNAISVPYLCHLFTAYSITEQDLDRLALESRKARCIDQFNKFTAQLGHAPNSTELQRIPKGRPLYARITRFWGSIDNFRADLSLPKPRHTRPHWLDAWREIALVKRMQHLDTLRDSMSCTTPLGINDICERTSFGANRVRRLVALLMATGEVTKTGQLQNTKYLLHPY